MSRIHKLPIKFLEQGERSANCGPCSVKMFLDFHDIHHPQTKDKFTLQQINRLLQTSTEFGCQEDDILNFFERFEINVQKISPNEIIDTLEAQKPILCSFKDELFDGHYALIAGHDSRESLTNPLLLFQDPWPDFGEWFGRKYEDFKEQAKDFNNWLYCLE